MPLNHPRTIPQLCSGWKNLSSVKLASGAQRLGTAALQGAAAKLPDLHHPGGETVSLQRGSGNKSAWCAMCHACLERRPGGDHSSLRTVCYTNILKTHPEQTPLPPLETQKCRRPTETGLPRSQKTCRREVVTGEDQSDEKDKGHFQLTEDTSCDFSRHFLHCGQHYARNPELIWRACLQERVEGVAQSALSERESAWKGASFLKVVKRPTVQGMESWQAVHTGV